MGESLGAKELSEIGRCRKLLPTEKDFIGRKGYARKYRADGSYEWTYDYKPNVQGKKTKAAAEVEEMMRPFHQADLERNHKLRGGGPKAAFKDERGQVQYLAPESLASKPSSWRHHWRAGGVPVVAGPQGMLFRWIKRQWEATGRLEAGIIGKRAPRYGIQRDPDGVPWRFVGGEWRAVA